MRGFSLVRTTRSKLFRLLTVASMISLPCPSLLAVCQEDQAYQKQTLAGTEFWVAKGLELQMATTSNELTHWPIVADMDEQGRLVVVESAGVSGGIEDHGVTKPHRMVRLSDEDRDGLFERREVIATDLAFPEGVLCVGKTILVGTPPQIWAFEDRDENGVYETRSIWFDGGTLTHCGNDLHGPYRGRDGFIYWCKGAFAEQKHQLTNGKELVTKASHLFRRPLEGGPVEVVMTGGMDNPVEMATLANGERFFTSTFLQHPANGKRDGIVHAIYGGLYGKEHGVIEGHRRTGDLMPITIHLGPAAPSGLATLESLRLSESIGLTSVNCLVAAEFNLHRVSLHALTAEGASYRADSRDLLRTDRIDFHPTDVLEAADGSLLVIDTGGWYDLCCPSSGVDQAIAGGGIYRLLPSRSSRMPQTSNDRSKEQTNQGTSQVALLRSLDPWVRRHAALTLPVSQEISRELFALAMDAQSSIPSRLEAVWGLCRSGKPWDREHIRGLLQVPVDDLRIAAMHAISVKRWSEAALLEEMVVSKASPAVRRVAAEALGRVGTLASIKPLMQALASAGNDRCLRHSLIYAMIELEHPEPLLAYLRTGDDLQRTIAMQVLDQLSAADLTPSLVAQQLDADSRDVRSMALSILARHPEWADDTSAWAPRLDVIANQASQDDNASEARKDLLLWASSWRGTALLQNWLKNRIADAGSQRFEEQELTLDMLSKMQWKKLQAECTVAIASWLRELMADPLDAQATRQRMLEWLASVALEPGQDRELIELLRTHAMRPTVPFSERVTALAALPMASEPRDDGLQSLALQIAQHLATDEVHAEEAPQRLPFAEQAMGKVMLEGESAQELTSYLKRLSPTSFAVIVACLSRTPGDAFQEQFLADLPNHGYAKTLAPGFLSQLYRQRSAELQKRAAKVDSLLVEPATDIGAKLSALEKELPEGEATRGFQVFRNPKHACSSCHQIGYVGGSIGPELTRIGATRTKRDLLEAIVLPSVRLAASYQPIRVQTTEGEVFNGLLRNETSDELEIVVSAEKVLRIAKSDVERRQPSDVSIMPSGLEQTMSLQDLADLIAMLQSKR